MTRGVPDFNLQDNEPVPAKAEVVASSAQSFRCYYCVFEGFSEVPETVVMISGTSVCFPHAKKVIGDSGV